MSDFWELFFDVLKFVAVLVSIAIVLAVNIGVGMVAPIWLFLTIPLGVLAIAFWVAYLGSR